MGLLFYLKKVKSWNIYLFLVELMLLFFSCPVIGRINAQKIIYLMDKARHTDGQTDMGSGDSSVVRVSDLWLKGPRFESWQEQQQNFLLHGKFSVLTLILVSISPSCYRFFLFFLFKMSICIVQKSVAHSVLLLCLYANWYGSKWGFVRFTKSWRRMIHSKHFITIDVKAIRW